MAFEAKWFWKALRPRKKDPGTDQHKQEQLKLPLTPEEAYKNRVAKRKRKAQKSARRRNRR